MRIANTPAVRENSAAATAWSARSSCSFRRRSRCFLTGGSSRPTACPAERLARQAAQNSISPPAKRPSCEASARSTPTQATSSALRLLAAAAGAGRGTDREQGTDLWKPSNSHAILHSHVRAPLLAHPTRCARERNARRHIFRLDAGRHGRYGLLVRAARAHLAVAHHHGAGGLARNLGSAALISWRLDRRPRCRPLGPRAHSAMDN